MANGAGFTVPLVDDTKLSEVNETLMSNNDKLIEGLMSLQDNSVSGLKEVLSNHTNTMRESFEALMGGKTEGEVAKDETFMSKLLKYFNTVFVKKKWHEQVFKSIKEQAENASSWIVKLLGFMALVALIGPETLLSLIPYVSDMLKSALAFFVKMMPVMLDATMRLFIGLLPVVWDALKSIGSAIWDAISSQAKIFWESLFSDEKGVSALREFGILLGIVGGLSAVIIKLISSFTFLGKIFKFISGMSPVLKGLFTSLKMLGSVLLKINSLFFTITRALISGLLVSLKALGTFLLANPIVIGIAAIIASLTLMWSFGDEISEFMEGLWGKLKSLSVGFQILIGALAYLFLPITTLIGLIYLLTKSFSIIKKEGLVKFFKILGKGISRGIDYIKEGLSSLGSSLYDWIITPIVETFSWSNITKTIGEFTSNIWDSIKNIFYNLQDSFKGLMDWALSLITPGESMSLEQATSLQFVQRTFQVSEDRISELAKGAVARTEQEKELQVILEQELQGKDPKNEQELLDTLTGLRQTMKDGLKLQPQQAPTAYAKNMEKIKKR